MEKTSLEFSRLELRLMASLLLHLRRQNAFDIEDDTHVPVSQIAWQLERLRKRFDKAAKATSLAEPEEHLPEWQMPAGMPPRLVQRDALPVIDEGRIIPDFSADVPDN